MCEEGTKETDGPNSLSSRQVRTHQIMDQLDSARYRQTAVRDSHATIHHCH